MVFYECIYLCLNMVCFSFHEKDRLVEVRFPQSLVVVHTIMAINPPVPKSNYIGTVTI